MLDQITPETSNLSTPYAPVALYFHDSDSVEYVRKDVPCIYRRVDDLLTLALDFDSRELVGFRIKGFKNFYLRELKPKLGWLDSDFLLMVTIIERAAEFVGNDFFDPDRKEAYNRVHQLAEQDHVRLHDLPEAA